MYTYFLTGRVIPERANVFISTLDFKVKYPASAIKFTEIAVSISIVLSQISIIVKSDEPIKDFFSLKNYLYDTLHLALDILGYIYGRGYDSEIISLVDQHTGEHIVFGVGISSLESNQKRPLKFPEVINLFKGNEPFDTGLRIALLNFKLGIRHPADTGFYCYRAIESIKKTFGVGNEGWELMRSALSVKRDWIDELKLKHADEQRHGGTTFMSGKQREEMLGNVQEAIDKFVVYLKNEKS